MASTYTVNIGIEKPGTGDQSGTWGVTTNTNFDIIDQATNGVATVTLAAAGTSGSPNTLLINNGALSDGRNRFIQFNDGADLGATAYVQLDPNDAEKIVHIRNSLSGSRSLILFQGTYNASNDFEVPNGADVLVKFDGGGTGATVTDVNVNLTPTKVTTGDLDVDNININGNTISSTDTNGNITLAPNGTGVVALSSTNLTFGDNDKAIFGAGSDLQIYHNASHSYIDEQSGTGNLIIRGANVVIDDDSNQRMATFTDGGAVSLRHNGSEKLATTATGVDVTGTVTADGLTVDGNATIVNNLGRLTLSDSDATNQKVFLDSNGGSAGITAQNNTSHGTIFLKRYNGTDTLITLGVSSNGDIRFFADNGTTQGLYWDASTQRLGLGTTSPATALDVTGTMTVDGITSSQDINITESIPQLNLIDTDGTNVQGSLVQAGGNLLIRSRNGTSTFGSFIFARNNGADTNVFRTFSNGDFSLLADDGTTEALRFDASTQRLGLGTTTPVATLEVDGTTTLTGGGTGSIHVNVEDSSLCPTMTFTRNGAGTVTNGFLKFEDSGGQVAEINAAGGGYFLGNVGIGTNLPDTTMHIHASSAGTVDAVSGGVLTLEKNNNAVLQFLTPNDKKNIIYFGDPDDIDAGRLEYAHSVDAMLFNVNASERMRISSGGNVGIGTTSPSSQLHIQNSGSASARIISGTTGSSTLFLGDTDEANQGSIQYNHGSDFMRFYTNNAERMRIDSSGNVGIGSNSPSGILDIKDTSDSRWLFQRNGTETELKIISGTNEDSSLYFGDNADNVRGGIRYDSSANALRFMGFNNSERMRIDSSGNVGIGTASVDEKLDVNGNAKLTGTGRSIKFDKNGSGEDNVIYYDNTTANNNLFIGRDSSNVALRTGGSERMRIDSSGKISVNTSSVAGTGWVQINAVTADALAMRFKHNGATVGSINTTSSSTSYNESSDYRLKENVVAMTGAIDRVKALAPKRFNFIVDQDTTVDGFIAHEAATIVPEAVTGTHNEVDGDGNPVYQGIDKGKLVPLLTGALQEAIAKIETLETEMTALKARVTTLEAN